MQAIIIDDEISAVNLFVSTIADNQDIGVKIFVNDPKKILEYASEDNKIDVVFLDINMPTINGIDLAMQLIKIRPDCKIVFITGYANNVEEIKAKIGENLKGFLYKPYEKAEIDRLIASLKPNKLAKNNIKYVTFGSFNMYVNEVPIKFSCKKSKELLALLVDGNGAILLMDDIIAKLWKDTDIKNSRLLYRNSVWRLRKTLIEEGVEDCVEFMHGKMRANNIIGQCDMWEFIKGKDVLYFGEYLQGYEWAEYKKGVIEELVSKSKQKKRSRKKTT